MNPTPIQSILISNTRQRQEFDPAALMELTESIRGHGLFHPIVVRQTPEGLMLVAGERRLRAITDLWMLGGDLTHNGQLFPEGTIPTVNLGDLPPLEAEECELDENLHRRDLSWQEHASAVQRLHTLRQAQAALRGESHTVAQTALEVTGRSDGAYQAQTRKENIVAQHLSDPDVEKAKSLDDAFKILKRKEEVKRNIEMAELVGGTLSVQDHVAIQADCLPWMAAHPPESFDVILTDPPYGMNADQFGDGAGKFQNIEHHYTDSPEAWLALMKIWCPLSFRITKPEAHAYVWCDFDKFHALKEMMQAAGWYVFRTPIIGVKAGGGRVPLPEHGPRRTYETCLYAIKGKKRTTHIYPDVITCPADPNDGHGATKPIALYMNLLQRSVQPGDRVLDCFAGSGPIFPAAHLVKCYATGIEQSPEYYALCLKRLQKLELEYGKAGVEIRLGETELVYPALGTISSAG